MSVLVPSADVTIAPIPAVEGLQISPPIFWHATALQMDQEAGTDSDGRYIAATGEYESRGELLLQDTYKTGSSSRTGRPFTVVDGTWYDDWVAPWSGKYGLLMPDGTSGTTWEVLDTIAGAQLANNLIVVRRGMAPTAATHASSAVYAYLELTYGSRCNWRIAMEYGQPVALDWYDYYGGAVWRRVASARNLGNFETLLAQNDGEVRFRTRYDRTNHVVCVEVGDGNWLRHRAMYRKAVVPLPDRECYRFYGANGWASLEVHPLRFAPLTLTKSPLYVGRPIANLAEAQIIPNSLGASDLGTVTGGTVTQGPDGELQYTASAEREDAGDAVAGSEDPATFSDVGIYIPGVWQGWSPFWPVPTNYPPVMHVHEVMVGDDVTRTISSQATITVNNRDGSYTDSWGNYAVNLAASNGLQYGQRLYGMICGPDGISTHRHDPYRVARLNVRDTTYKLGVPIGQELVLDGWCLYSAVRMVLECGQVPPWRMGRIPWYRPGPAGYDCPYPILGRGTGLNAKLRFPADRTCMSILLELVQDAGVVNPITGANVPFIFGQDAQGNYYFTPYDPRSMPVAASYTDNDPSGLGQIGQISVYNSVADMRTEVTFQGQDPFTYELLNGTLPMPWNLAAVGYRYPWFERNSRWASQEYIETLLSSAARMASIGTQIVHMQVPFNPWLFPFDVIHIFDRNALGRGGFFVVTMLDNRYGLVDAAGFRGERECTSWVTARSIESLIPW